MDTQLRTPFTPFQMKLLIMSQRVKTEEEEKEIQALLAKYFADKLQKEVDQLWEEGVINDEVIESWKHEHMRTPYLNRNI